ncbi:MAG: histidine phosphatase family protein [Sciscionella sp.]|nr:histidine phosphatase family protein [Sciscionella sp.]
MRTVVHFLRHGEVHNPDGVLYGRLPGYRLSELGRKQALRVAEYLADRDIVHVVASPLQRARETAAPIVDSHQLELATDDRLIEAANVFEGKRVSVGDGILRRPRYWPKLWNPFRPSWGEPYGQVAQRMLAAAHAARQEAAGHEAVCVSHQLPIVALRRRCEHKHLWHDPRRRECSLASLTSLEFHGEELATVHYSQPAGYSNPKVTGA